MLLSVKDVAKILGYSDSQIRRLIRQGAIKAQSLGAYYAIDEVDLPELKKPRPPASKAKKKKART